MNCPHCGVQLPRRPAARAIMTGSLFVAAGFILLFFVHLAVVVLASVILVATGATFVRGALQAHVFRCPSCGHVPRLQRGRPSN
jgi:predicted RNA-binding Zn-ribbon protein involved in translation (DUF1610 family)